MHLTRTLAALGLSATGLAVATSTPAIAEDPPTSAPAMMTTEQDCHETNINRAVSFDGLRSRVPDRYALFRLPAGSGRLTVTTYTCSAVSVDEQPVVGNDTPTTVTIGSVNVTHRDGVALAQGQQQYIVWYGTDNPVLFAKLQQTGLPVTFLPRSSATVTSDGTTDTASWAIRGAGLDYSQTVTGPEPTAVPREVTTAYWFDGPEGDLVITYRNQLADPPGTVSADFGSNEVLSQIIAQPSQLQINGVAFPYIRGSWTSEVRFVPTP